ncbi:MAG: hypothetical protein GY908_10630 [Flavobacteriales bacterium]|nr:hypothetical protein [Flavobacteriales bacterium]
MLCEIDEQWSFIGNKKRQHGLCTLLILREKLY